MRPDAQTAQPPVLWQLAAQGSLQPTGPDGVEKPASCALKDLFLHGAEAVCPYSLGRKTEHAGLTQKRVNWHRRKRFLLTDHASSLASVLAKGSQVTIVVFFWGKPELSHSALRVGNVFLTHKEHCRDSANILWSGFRSLLEATLQTQTVVVGTLGRQQESVG